ncbi:MAG: efflux RND transporter permease subunit [Kiritimatiellae bacterium]|nr:efflux RND transporter permease subunit [Kiritimatiellia bacterium]
MKRPIAAVMVFFAVLILGYVSYRLIPVDMMPEIETPTITINTSWDGASPEDMETKVTRLMESVLGGVTDLDEISSTTREGVSRVTCKFAWGTELGEAANDMRDLVERAKRRLPDEADDPVMFKFNSANMPILFYGITARENRDKMNDTVNDEIVDVLKRVSGVGSVEAFGGFKRQINVRLDPVKLSAYGLSLASVAAVLGDENRTEPAGNLKVGSVNYTIRVPGEYSHPDEVGDVIVKRGANGELVRLSDVAEIEDGFVEIDSVVETNDKWAMMMMIQKRSGENTVAVCRRVRDRIAEIARTLPADYDIVLISDASETITRSINSVGSTVLWGGFFVILVTLLFLRNVRASLVIALTIPFSLIIAFIFMFAMGWTINIMSLSALAIAIGMVVDNAVVVLENILQHISRGARKREAAMFGADEVGLSIMASTLTTIAVFLPLVFVKGVTGIMFKQLGGLVTATLVASLFCSLYLTPMLASVILRTMEQRRAAALTWRGRFVAWSETRFEAFEAAYGRLVAACLRLRWLVIAVAAAVIALTAVLFSHIGSELMGAEDTGELRITYELPVGTRYEKTAAVGRRILQLARDTIPTGEITSYSFNAGGGGGGFGGPRNSHTGTIRVRLKRDMKRSKTTDEYGDAITAAVRDWPEIKRVYASTDNFLNRVLMGGGANIAIDIYGYDLATTTAIANRIKDIVEETPGSRNARISQDLGQPELALRIDRMKASSLGFSMDTLATALSTLFQGGTATQYREEDDEYDILLRLDEPSRRSIEDIRGSEIELPSGGRVRIDTFAEIEEIEGPVTIRRKNQERIVTVWFDVIGRAQGDVAGDVRKRIESEILLPDGVQIEYAGLLEEQAKSEQAMVLMIVLGVILVYMVLAGQFESFIHPFLIMFSVPFAGSGVALALLATDTPLSMSAYIGIVLLIGVVVNNAIVLIDYINITRARGVALFEAICQSARQRLRPVLITTLTTLFGMMPMALSRGDGSVMWRPLGITVCGGLAVSTFVTMLIIPVLYFVVERRRSHAPL